MSEWWCFDELMNVNSELVVFGLCNAMGPGLCHRTQKKLNQQ
jgi:hypothetical protein